MKKRILSLFFVFMMLFSALPALADDQMSYLEVLFMQEEITQGTVSALITAHNTTDDVTFTLSYYSDNTLIDCTSAVLDETTPSRQISLDTPDTVKEGDYAKIIAYNSTNLEPYIIKDSDCVIYCNQTRVSTYSGMNERYYTISSPDGALSVSKKVVSVNETGTLFRLKDMAEGYVAFEDYTTPKYRLEYTPESGVRAYFYSAGGAKQRWIMEEYNGGYTLLNANGGYLAIKDGNVIVTEDKYKWDITFAGETPFTLITSTKAFKLLTEAQQKRIVDICTSIGADALPFAANGKSFLDNCENTFKRLYSDSSMTDEAKKNAILSAVSMPVMGSGIVSPDFQTPVFVEEDAKITQSDPVKTTHVMWDLVEENGVIYSASADHPYTGKPINCYRIDVRYTSDTGVHTVKVYCVDPNFANVQNAITALAKIPHEYRKNVKNMYVYYSSTDSTYNLGYNPDYNGDELFVRLNGTATVDAMVESFVHELGHSLDYHANSNPVNSSTHWSQGTAWQTHVANDIVTVSGYGNSNFYENFAEFARLYWLCYSNRDYQIGLHQLYPNSIASFERALGKIGINELY